MEKNFIKQNSIIFIFILLVTSSFAQFIVSDTHNVYGVLKTNNILIGDSIIWDFDSINLIGTCEKPFDTIFAREFMVSSPTGCVPISVCRNGLPRQDRFYYIDGMNGNDTIRFNISNDGYISLSAFYGDSVLVMNYDTITLTIPGQCSIAIGSLFIVPYDTIRDMSINVYTTTTLCYNFDIFIDSLGGNLAFWINPKSFIAPVLQSFSNRYGQSRWSDFLDFFYGNSGIDIHPVLSYYIDQTRTINKDSWKTTMSYNVKQRRLSTPCMSFSGYPYEFWWLRKMTASSVYKNGEWIKFVHSSTVDTSIYIGTDGYILWRDQIWDKDGTTSATCGDYITTSVPRLLPLPWFMY